MLQQVAVVEEETVRVNRIVKREFEKSGPAEWE